MRQYAWFVLAIKAIGVLLIGKSLSGLLYPIQFIGWIWDDTMPLGLVEIITMAIAGLGPLVQFIFGLYLLLGGRRIINRCIRMVDGHCIVCGYDVRGLGAEVCPECGTSTASTTGSMGSGTSGSLGEYGEGEGDGQD